MVPYCCYEVVADNAALVVLVFPEPPFAVVVLEGFCIRVAVPYHGDVVLGAFRIINVTLTIPVESEVARLAQRVAHEEQVVAFGEVAVVDA